VLGEESPCRLPRQASLGSRRVLSAGRRLGLLLALSLAGCAEMQEATGVATQQDLLQLRQEMAAAQQSAQRARLDADAVAAQVDKRVREQSSERDKQVATLNRQVDSLNDTVTSLSGKVDELNTKLDAVNRQLRGAAPPAGAAGAAGAAAATTPRPPAAAPPSGAAGSAASPPAGASAGQTPGPVAVAPSRPTTGALQPQDIYQAAYIDFSKGSYSLAIAGFREFLRRYPDHELAGSAQYWIGEAYLSLARGFSDASQNDKASESLEQAVQEFKKVQANYPRADKVPTALYKEALALIDLKQPAVAQTRLQYLVDNVPRAEETPLARERLNTLKSR
jgi:tol-pal system protein YbgF